MKSPDILVDKKKLKKMYELNSCSTLIERKSKAKGSIFHLNKEYIIVGTCSSYEKGIVWVEGYTIVDFMLYKGELKPLTSDEHYLAVQAGTRERGYKGQIAFIDKRKIVFCEEQTFRPYNGPGPGEQTTLF